jgi:hypothetical protein
MNIRLFKNHPQTEPTPGFVGGKVSVIPDIRDHASAYVCGCGRCEDTVVLIRGSEDRISETLGHESMHIALTRVQEEEASRSLDRFWVRAQLDGDDPWSVDEAETWEKVSRHQKEYPAAILDVQALQDEIQRRKALGLTLKIRPIGIDFRKERVPNGLVTR